MGYKPHRTSSKGSGNEWIHCRAVIFCLQWYVRGIASSLGFAPLPSLWRQLNWWVKKKGKNNPKVLFNNLETIKWSSVSNHGSGKCWSIMSTNGSLPEPEFNLLGFFHTCISLMPILANAFWIALFINPLCTRKLNTKCSSGFSALQGIEQKWTRPWGEQ